MKSTRFLGPTTYLSCALLSKRTTIKLFTITITMIKLITLANNNDVTVFRGDTMRYKYVTNRPVAAPTFMINRHSTWHRQHARSYALSTTTAC